MINNNPPEDKSTEVSQAILDDINACIAGNPSSFYISDFKYNFPDNTGINELAYCNNTHKWE